MAVSMSLREAVAEVEAREVIILSSEAREVTIHSSEAQESLASIDALRAVAKPLGLAVGRMALWVEAEAGAVEA